MDPAGQARPRQVTTINDKWRLVHRGSRADLGVLQDVFGDQSYAFMHFKHGAPLREYHSLALRQGRPLIVDCGANIGASAVYFAAQFPDATIIAVEPEPENFELLGQNLRQLQHVGGIDKAVASSAGTVVLRDPGEGEWGYRAGVDLAEGRAVGEVETVTIAEIVEAVPDAVPFVLKVDIEGAEGDLFSRNTDAISDFPLVSVELHDWLMPTAGTSESFLRWHLAEHRDLVQRGENVFSMARWLWDPQRLRQMAQRRRSA